MLGELSNPDKRIFALSFHVDYWNRLGWVDPFSQKTFSQRQRRYAQVLKDNRVYTPEMVVNGRDGFVGSDRRRAQLRIDQALDDAPEGTLVLGLSQGAKKDRLLLEYRLDVVFDSGVLNVALVEKNKKVDVPRGENAGRTLQHHHIVREFVTVKADSSGTVRLKIPNGLQRGDVDVIAFVQNRETMHVLAADMVSVNP